MAGESFINIIRFPSEADLIELDRIRAKLGPESIFDEAKQVVEQRAAQYDVRERNFARIAGIWSVIFEREVTPEQVALCMIGMKLAREMYKPSRENRVDICGYADCLEDLVNGNSQETKPQAESGYTEEGIRGGRLHS